MDCCVSFIVGWRRLSRASMRMSLCPLFPVSFAMANTHPACLRPRPLTIQGLSRDHLIGPEAEVREQASYNWQFLRHPH